MSTFAEGLQAPGMRAAGLAVSPWMALAAGMDTDTEDDGRKMLAAAERNAEKGGTRSREEAAAGVTLGECAVTSPPPAMPSATALRARERARGDARVLGIVGLEFCGHDSIR